MALNNDAVLTAAKGYIFTAPINSPAPKPTDIAAYTGSGDLTDTNITPVTWVNIGNTSRDDLPEFGFDGGDTETRGTWQNEALKTVVTDPAVDYVTFNLVQFDDAALALYYGTANGSSTNGVYQVNGSPGGATQKALLIVIVDGAHKVGFHASKTEIRREDSISLATDEFGALPLRSTFLTPDTAGIGLFSWIDEDNINPAP